MVEEITDMKEWWPEKNMTIWEI